MQMDQRIRQYFKDQELIEKYVTANAELHGLYDVVKLGTAILSGACDDNPDVMLFVREVDRALARAAAAMRAHKLTRDREAIREIANNPLGEVQHG
jgi:hypothetical protein